MTERGHFVDECLLSDGGEGSLDALGGPNRWSVVTGPLGDLVDAGWRLDATSAFIEMAQASGLRLVGGAQGNEPLAASTYGTGELVSLAYEAGAREITVFLGGSATTDGGLGAQRAMPLPPRLKSVELVAATDVDTLFIDAAAVFGPQKGAGRAQVELLTRRLESLAVTYQEKYGIDVRSVPGSGAAGGLAGGLAAVGASIVSGFDFLAEKAHLDSALEAADVVLTGEGFCDTQSFRGKVVGGVSRWSERTRTPVVAIVGGADLDDREIPDHVEVISLTERFGLDRALRDTAPLVAEVARVELAKRT